MRIVLIEKELTSLEFGGDIRERSSISPRLGPPNFGNFWAFSFISEFS